MGGGERYKFDEWFSAYVDTKYKIPKCKQQSTHVDGLVVQAAKKMMLIQGKDDVLLLDIALVYFGHLWTINNKLE